MVRETKAGLIAGLAFIICFAVILANRGDPSGRPKYSLDLTQPAPTPSGDWQIPAQTPIPTPTPGPPAERVIADSAPAAAQVPATTPVPADSTTTSALTMLEKRLDELAAEVTSQRGSLISPTSRTVPSRVPSAAPVADTKAPPRRTPSGDARSVLYTVVPGDTLSRIAALHFGSRAGHFVDAIFDANRGILESPDVVRVGMKLVIPVVDGTHIPSYSRSDSERASPVSPSAAPNRDTTEPLFTWYQIKKNDGYASIAREQLGDVSRWPEIHRLNMDKFPDPQQIRAGVRIKLPARGIADARAARP